jgi:hypothetical protein
MYLISRITQFQLLCIILYVSYIYNKLLMKYKQNNDILLNSYYIYQYDKIHDLYILEYRFNIKIYTYINTKSNIIYIDIYHDDIKKSGLLIKDNKILYDKQSQIILTINYLDNYNIANQIKIYNCGIVYHKNFMINNYYNYKGSKRNKIN